MKVRATVANSDDGAALFLMLDRRLGARTGAVTKGEIGEPGL
jgi:hypothetical protein